MNCSVESLVYYCMPHLIWNTLSSQHHFFGQSFPTRSISDEWGWDTSHTNLRPQSPGSELYSPTSIWIAIVQVWIHPVPESLLHINEPKSEKEVFFFFFFSSPSPLLSHLLHFMPHSAPSRIMSRGVHVCFRHLSMLNVLVSSGACMVPTCLCQSLLFWLVAGRVGVAIYSNDHNSWETFNPWSFI